MGRAPTDTRQRLIDTVLDLLWKSSYGAVSVDDICAAANVRKGSFYYFFPTKAELVSAALHDLAERSQEQYDEIFSTNRPPIARISRLAEYLYELQVSGKEKHGHVCGCPYAAVSSEMAVQERCIRLRFQEISKMRICYYESAIRDMVSEGLIAADTDIAAKAQELYAYVAGQLTLARIQDNLLPLKANLENGLVQLLGVHASAAAASVISTASPASATANTVGMAADMANTANPPNMGVGA